MGDSPEDVTALLRNWRRGDHAAFEQLVPLVQHRLRESPARTSPASARDISCRRRAS